MDYAALSSHKNPCPGVMKFTILHIIPIYFFLSTLCSIVVKNTFKEIKHFHDMTNIVRPQHNSSCSRDHAIKDFSRLFLIIIHLYILSFYSVLLSGLKKKTFVVVGLECCHIGDLEKKKLNSFLKNIYSSPGQRTE